MEKIEEIKGKLKEMIKRLEMANKSLTFLPLSKDEARQILTALEGPSEEEMFDTALVEFEGSESSYLRRTAFKRGAEWCKNWKGGKG